MYADPTIYDLQEAVYRFYDTAVALGVSLAHIDINVDGRVSVLLPSYALSNSPPVVTIYSALMGITDRHHFDSIEDAMDYVKEQERNLYETRS